MNMGIDLIDRQTAIDVVDEGLTGVFVEHRAIAEKMIGKLPSVQPEHGYIERQVKEDGRK